MVQTTLDHYTNVCCNKQNSDHQHSAPISAKRYFAPSDRFYQALLTKYPAITQRNAEGCPIDHFGYKKCFTCSCWVHNIPWLSSGICVRVKQPAEYDPEPLERSPRAIRVGKYSEADAIKRYDRELQVASITFNQRIHNLRKGVFV